MNGSALVGRVKTNEREDERLCCRSEYSDSADLENLEPTTASEPIMSKGSAVSSEHLKWEKDPSLRPQLRQRGSSDTVGQGLQDGTSLSLSR